MTRRALITGATAGLGLEFARQFAGEGHDLLLVARRESRLVEVADALRRDHAIDVAVCTGDLADRETPERIERFVAEAGLPIDYLVNNAGSAGPHLLEPTPWPDQARFLELMMMSVAQMCHRFIPPMRERGFGRVINVSSFAGRIARPAGANYGPAKAYLVALSEELALELGGSGVHVSAFCPGFVHTDFHETGGLMDMKRGLPAWIWYDAETVVKEAIEAVERGHPIQVSGRIYRWLDPFAQSVWVRALIKRFAPGR